MNIAKATVPSLVQGEVFLVKDLFRGFEWNRIAKGNRTKLGSMFLNYAEKHASNSLKILGKTPQNQQMYEKL
ncbi:single-stranded DNA-binding protein [Paenibacillus sp. FSL R7-0128]|uniref:single-stranded DNA-binding protein n=1 Tax=Paenibacillus sp. FSL P2-0089 TaxID=2954526 RepID=UPI00056A211F|nr:single-stranded DNA-binding protein [Paenibacillus sp. FSL R7-277]